MFNKKYDADGADGIVLAFIKSLDIKAFPCGRRRSMLVDTDNNPNTANSYYIPFDPEARLNTEYNNIRSTGLNGSNDSYINSWNNNIFSITVGGYNFEINLTNIDNENSFANKFTSCIGTSNVSKIYANIRLTEIPLFSDDNKLTYKTWILRNQSETENPATELDLPISTSSKKIEDFYFSGISFSSRPLTYKYSGEENITRDNQNCSENSEKQQVFSLCILEKQDKNWVIHKPALLPKIEHGDLENSVKMGTLTVDKLARNTANGEVGLMSLTIDTTKGKNRLVFTSSNRT